MALTTWSKRVDFGRLIARWSSFMHVSVYLDAESPCQFPVFQTTHFGALVRPPGEGIEHSEQKVAHVFHVLVI